MIRWLVLGVCLIGSTSVAFAADYDAALAQRLGADEYGMKTYVLVILKAGPNTDLSKDERAKAFRGHMANIHRLAEAGKLIVAGPFEDNAQHYEGIFVFNVPSVAEAEPLIKSDPAIAAGALAYEAYAWYGSAALQEVGDIHARIAKRSP
ncbi:MAG: hypothetical protein GC190_04685 [Alphaproteobacteria bacterium]|nr:hypothetical protein [Alphaproteobacteria bacterium]